MEVLFTSDKYTSFQFFYYLTAEKCPGKIVLKSPSITELCICRLGGATGWLFLGRQSKFLFGKCSQLGQYGKLQNDLENALGHACICPTSTRFLCCLLRWLLLLYLLLVTVGVCFFLGGGGSFFVLVVGVGAWGGSWVMSSFLSYSLSWCSCIIFFFFFFFFFLVFGGRGVLGVEVLFNFFPQWHYWQAILCV